MMNTYGQTDLAGRPRARFLLSGLTVLSKKQRWCGGGNSMDFVSVTIK